MPQLVAEEPTSVRQELDARIQALEAMIRHHRDAPRSQGKRPPKERNVEVPTTLSVEETEHTSEEESRADDDSTEINFLGSYRRDY